MTREELKELIAQKLYDADTSDIPDREEWEELDGEDARDYMRRAEVAMEALDKAGIGLVDWDAPLPPITQSPDRYSDLEVTIAIETQREMLLAGWRPVRRLVL